MSRKIDPFQLEIFFAKYEFVASHLLCCSDAESFSMKEVIATASEETLALWDNLRLSYTETKGLPELLKEVAFDYPGLTHEDILCFAGGEEGIYCTLKTILNPEDHVIVITPCYQSLKSIAESICSISTIDLSPSNGWKLDMTELESLIIGGKTKMIIMNFPHNPTGALLTHEEQQTVVELARKYDLFLFFDEIYRGLESNESLRLPTVASIYNKGISLGGMSKVYGMAGLRIGWIALADKQWLHEIAETKHYLSICNSAPSEILALIARQGKDTLVTRNLDIIEKNLVLLDAFLLRHSKCFAWVRPNGGCTGFVEVLVPGINLNEVAELLVQRHGVLILPGDVNFPITDACENNIKNHFRIGFARKNFPVVLEKFEECFVSVLESVGVKDVMETYWN